MKSHPRRKKHQTSGSDPFYWLPIDSRFVPSFRFTHVHGLARLFLSCEMVLSVLVVFGTLVLVFVRMFSQ